MKTILYDDASSMLIMATI